MKLMGISDEAANTLDGQLEATRALGWKFIEMRGVEVRGFPKANFHDISDAAFDAAVTKLEAANIHVYCFGSAVMNWAKRVGDPFETTLSEIKRAIPRMQRLGTRYIRIMSFKPDDDTSKTPREVFQRVKDVTNRFLDAGIQPLHENCMNHGGMSWQHALELLEKCPGLKWLFDPANPVFNPDRSKPKPWPKQDPWEFWMHVREHVAHIHIKDAILEFGETGRRLHVARGGRQPVAGHSHRRNRPEVRCGYFSGTAHGGGVPRCEGEGGRRNHAEELCGIRPACGVVD